jgi:hypothetical protein
VIAVFVIGVLLAVGAVLVARRLPGDDMSPDQAETPVAVGADA